MDSLLKNLTLDFFGTGQHKITPDKLMEKENVFLLDVRSREEAQTLAFHFKHHPNITSENIPLNELPDKINDIPKEKFIAIFCPAGVRSSIAFIYLLSKGFKNVRIIEGGYPGITETVKPGKVLKVIRRQK